MYGTITKFDTMTGHGVIETEAGQRYRFAKSEVRNPNGRFVGYGADFLVDTRQPKEIVLMHGTPWTVFGETSH
jgi:hypothetical protein